MASADITTLYSGNTADWSADNKAVFMPNGVVKGYFKHYRFSGKWTVKDNIICMSNIAYDTKAKTSDNKIFTDCWEYYTTKNKVYTFYRNDWEKKKWDRKNDWYDERKNLKMGDKASAKYIAMGGK